MNTRVEIAFFFKKTLINSFLTVERLVDWCAGRVGRWSGGVPVGCVSFCGVK